MAVVNLSKAEQRGRRVIVQALQRLDMSPDYNISWWHLQRESERCWRAFCFRLWPYLNLDWQRERKTTDDFFPALIYHHILCSLDRKKTDSDPEAPGSFILSEGRKRSSFAYPKATNVFDSSVRCLLLQFTPNTKIWWQTDHKPAL